MKHRGEWILGMLLALSMLLGACAPAATSAPAEPIEMPIAEVEEPEQPVPAPIEASPADLDAAVNAFLDGMQGYNALRMDPFVEMLTQEPAPFLLDVRELSEVEENGYIPGAVVIPLRELADNLGVLPAFDQPIVSYCGSGWRCTIAMTALGTLGWENVLSLKDNSFGGYKAAGYEVTTGLPTMAAPSTLAMPDPTLVLVVDEMLSGLPQGWGGVSVDDLALELAESPELILIDVRTQAEIEERGSIEADNALAIPLQELVDRRAEWPADLDAPIVVYCGSGHRSTIAMTILYTYGYSVVRSLKGGFAAWTQAGFPTVSGTPDLDAAYTAFLGRMVQYNTIGLAALNEQLALDTPPFLLDVRQPDEVEANGHIEGSVLIPLRELMQNLDLLPSFDTPIVSYCGSGWRCTIAITGLGALGWTDVSALKENSYGGWVAAGYPFVEGLPPEAESLNAASPDPAMVTLLDNVFSSIPEGWEVITVDQLATDLVENPDLVVIDVRTAPELAEKGVIEPTQLSIPLEEFITRKAEWPADLDTPIVTYCGSGHRCTIAMAMLWSYGYTDVRSLKGGFGAWVEAGYPVAELAAP